METPPGTRAVDSPPPPADTLEASPSRVAAASSLRELGHALVGHAVDDAVLERIAAFASEIRAEVETGEPRSRPVDDMKRRLFAEPPAPGETMFHYSDCVVSGPANPLGIAVEVHREGDDAVATVVLGQAFEGAPQRAHGGIVAAVFDDVLGFVLSIERTPAYTGSLTVHYRAPTPLGVELEFRGRLVRRQGRKLWIDGEARHADVVVAEAEGLFIAIPPERFGLPPNG